MREKAMMIVPHQDDETDLCGNIIDVITKKYELYILYSSLDSIPEKGKIRKQEAINACVVWGIQPDHLIFLGYPDSPNKLGHHWFTDGDQRIVDDLKSHILSLQPAVIFATDFDFHSDHRMLSISFEMAIGQILKEETDYQPIVLKGFCYETAYYGVEDYKASCPGKSTSNIVPLSNPSYEWDNRISIESSEERGVIWSRKAYKALAAHKSQYAILHARSIVNADNVFWLRRTDNLLKTAKLSGDVDGLEKICDFLILETDDIITKNPREIEYIGACSIDAGTEIKAIWDEPVVIDRVVLHGSINEVKDKALTISIVADGETLGNIYELRAYGRDSMLGFPHRRVKELAFFFSEKTYLTEIEVLYGDMKNRLFDTPEMKKCSMAQETSRVIDWIDMIGYQGIVFSTKIKRKIRKVIKR